MFSHLKIFIISFVISSLCFSVNLKARLHNFIEKFDINPYSTEIVTNMMLTTAVHLGNIIPTTFDKYPFHKGYLEMVG